MDDAWCKISSLMSQAEGGDSSAAAALFDALYAELHSLAKRELSRQSPVLTLSATTLLHEAYLNMAGRGGTSFPDQARFMGYAARVMRGLIIDYARRRRALKRGGHFEITQFGTEGAGDFADPSELMPIGEALDELAKTDPALARVVDLRFFCGFSYEEIAALQGDSESSVRRKWEKARIYLHDALRGPVSL
jgi:RNA polymerase sigma factor (TIGR02999 family)